MFCDISAAHRTLNGQEAWHIRDSSNGLAARLLGRLLSHHDLIDSKMPIDEFDEDIERTAFFQVIDNV